MFSSAESANTQIEEASTNSGRRLTRVERARLEALQAFGGGGLQDVMASSKRKIANNLKEKSEAPAEGGHTYTGNKENVDDCGEELPVQ